jgi:hypothetical protein
VINKEPESEGEKSSDWHLHVIYIKQNKNMTQGYNELVQTDQKEEINDLDFLLAQSDLASMHIEEMKEEPKFILSVLSDVNKGFKHD